MWINNRHTENEATSGQTEVVQIKKCRQGHFMLVYSFCKSPVTGQGGAGVPVLSLVGLSD